MSKKESGNVLFLILIAVVLFAALSYAVTKSTQSSGKGSSEEAARTGASTIMGYAASLRTSVMRMAMLRSSDPVDIMFSNDAWHANNGSVGHSLGTPSDPERYVFHPEGGGQGAITFEKYAVVCPGSSCTDPWTTAPGHGRIEYVNIPGVGTNAVEIAYRLWSPSKEVCEAINTILGIPEIPDIHVPTNSYHSGSSINPPPSLAAISRPDATLIEGESDFCYRGISSSGSNDGYNAYYYMSVLLPF